MKDAAGIEILCVILPIMKYSEFKNTIQNELSNNPDGLTWKELRDQLDLPYERPCPNWTAQLEEEIGLVRSKGFQRAYIWKLSAPKE